MSEIDCQASAKRLDYELDPNVAGSTSIRKGWPRSDDRLSAERDALYQGQAWIEVERRTLRPRTAETIDRRFFALESHGLRVRTDIEQVRPDLGRETIMIIGARFKKYPRTAGLSMQKAKQASGCLGQKSDVED